MNAITKKSPIDEWSNQIPEDLISSFKEDEPPVIFFGSGFGKEAVPSLKTGGELSEVLRKELDLDDNGENLAELLQYYKNTLAGSNKRVVDWLKVNLLHGKSEPGGAYRLLLELPSKIFLTTNFDSLMLKASRKMNYDLVAVDDPQSFNSVYTDVKSKPRSGILGRLHGAFETQEKMVFTTDDYIDWYTETGKQWRDLFEGLLRDKRIVFIGYSLRDFTNWTSFISVFKKWPKSMEPHALVSPAISKYYGPFWDNYSIKYIPLKAYQFLIAIHDRLGNLEDGDESEIPIAAVAACAGKTFEDAKKEIETRQFKNHYPKLNMAAIQMIMEGCYEN